MNTTDITAIVGASTGVAAILLSVFQEVRHHVEERPRLRLEARLVTPKTRKEQGVEPQLVVTVVNVGRRAVQLHSLGGHLVGGQHLPDWVYSDRLEEGQRVEILRPADSFDWDKLAGLYVTDSIDKRWPLSPRKFRKFLREARSDIRALQQRKEDVQKLLEEEAKGQQWPKEDK
jgi:hypothetical protein